MIDIWLMNLVLCDRILTMETEGVENETTYTKSKGI